MALWKRYGIIEQLKGMAQTKLSGYEGICPLLILPFDYA